MDHQLILRKLRPQHEFFIGIDSDGCVFDTMDVKHKEFFIPNVIKYFDLFPIAGPLRETWEFVNLYSSTRGINRFPALIKVFELAGKRKEVAEKDVRLPQLSLLKSWIKEESKLSNSTLRSFYEKTSDEDTGKVLRWSEAVNEDINRWLHDMPPFRHARMVIEKAGSLADTIVVSQTPLEALEREWKEHDLARFVRAIAGQEQGTKSEHISLAAGNKYSDNKILMIGDALGDLNAAENNHALFFPVIPGKEDDSWKRLLEEGLDRFLTGNFTKDYQEQLLKEFRKSLPETPPWK